VLSIYSTDIGEPGDQFEIEARIERLNEFWSAKKLSKVNAQTFAAYVKHRGNAVVHAATSRRFAPQSIIMQEKAFIGAWYACRFRPRARPAIDGSHAKKQQR
jgi:hypothetical protein